MRGRPDQHVPPRGRPWRISELCQRALARTLYREARNNLTTEWKTALFARCANFATRVQGFMCTYGFLQKGKKRRACNLVVLGFATAFFASMSAVSNAADIVRGPAYGPPPPILLVYNWT